MRRYFRLAEIPARGKRPSVPCPNYCSFPFGSNDFRRYCCLFLVSGSARETVCRSECLSAPIIRKFAKVPERETIYRQGNLFVSQPLELLQLIRNNLILYSRTRTTRKYTRVSFCVFEKRGRGDVKTHLALRTVRRRWNGENDSFLMLTMCNGQQKKFD